MYYYDDTDLSQSDSALTHMVIEDLELDDQHADFLDPATLQEEDEVEKMVGRVAEGCEQMSVNAGDSAEDPPDSFGQPKV